MKTKLLPCPFCGNPSPSLNENNIGDHAVNCHSDKEWIEDAAPEGSWHETPEAAIAAWNSCVRCRHCNTPLDEPSSGNVTACNSHAAKYAKIRALEDAGKALLEFLENYPHQHATDISSYESDLSAALALPCAPQES